MLHERPTFLLILGNEAHLQAVNDVLINFKHKKPLVVISQPGGRHETVRMEVEKKLADAGIPVFPSFYRAAKAVTNVIRYWEFRNNSLS